MIRSALYKILLPFWGSYNKAWLDRLYRWITRPAFSLRIRLHGRQAALPSDYIYPVIIRKHPQFNNPYLELVYQVYRIRQRKLVIVDAGAAVGDTFLFVISNLPGAIQKIYCIEGNEQFLDYLKKNLLAYPEGEIIAAIISDREEKIPSLEMHHASSASAQGNTAIDATTIDSIFHHHSLAGPDIVKLDLEGYDGKALVGSREILHTQKPALIFEYHPQLIKSTRGSFTLPFEVLEASGYTHCFWYDKFGNFSHESSVNEKSVVTKIAEECLSGVRGDDAHFDIIALAGTDGFDLAALKHCSFAVQKKYPY